jgi:tripartite-type tricarboxylate transporter receptor subunit TctC
MEVAMISKRSFLRLVVVGASLGRAGLALAQPYPTRLIKIVVPFPAGGPTDLMGRVAAQWLSSRLGQSVIVENQAGAGGTIGSRAVAHASADGYTLLLGGTNSNAISPAFYKNLDYDPVGDFVPVACVAIDSSAFMVAPSVPANTLGEFIQFAKNNPDKLSAGAPIGIAPHVTVAYFIAKTQAKIVLVPYKGGAPLITDLLGGQVQMTFGAKSAYLPHIRAGKMKALAVTSDARWPELPDVPTMSECGFTGFPGYQWFELLAPVRTPPSVIDTINAAINEGLVSGEMRAGLAKLGVEAKIQTPSELRTALIDDTRRWDAIVKSADIKLE